MTSAACSSFVSRMRRANTARRSARKPGACQNRSMHRAPRRLLVAVNPAASFGRNRAVGPAVAERLIAEGHDVSMLREANFELLRREAESAFAQGGIDGLVVVGGDGMVSLGVNLVAQTGVPLGIVAAGTGNDLARGLGLPYDDPAAGTDALVAALAREPRAIDAGVIRHGELRTWFAVRGLDGLRRRRERAREPDDPSPRSEPVHARPGARARHVPAAHLHDHHRRRAPRAAGDARLGGEQRVARRRHAHRAARRPRRRPARRVHRASALAHRPARGVPEGVRGRARRPSRGRVRAGGTGA